MGHKIPPSKPAVFSLAVGVHCRKKAKRLLYTHTNIEAATLAPIGKPRKEFNIRHTELRRSDGITPHSIQNKLMPKLVLIG